MRHQMLIFLILILLPSLCIASQDIGGETACNLFLLGEEIKTQKGPADLYIDGKVFQLQNRKKLYFLRNKTKIKNLVVSEHYYIHEQINVSCSEGNNVYVLLEDVSPFLSIIKEDRIKHLSKKIKNVNYLSFVNGQYRVKKKVPINGQDDFAKLFDNPTNYQAAESKASKPSQVVPTQKVPSTMTSRVKSKPVDRNAIAVIIGNRNYSKNNPDVPDVDYALNDAELMYQFVTQKLGFREGNIIYLKDATQADLIRTFGVKGNAEGNLYDWVRPNKSEVFVYYSGHGAPGISNGQGYLLPVDADPHKVELNGYSLGTLYNNLSQIPAKEMTIIMDACFSGGSANGSVIRNASSIALRRIETEVQLPNAAVLSATGLYEVASWDKNQRLGLFTRYFFEGVNGAADKENFGNGDGKVTLGELKNYLEDEVTYQARRQYGRKQHPSISGDYERVIAELN